MQHGDCQIAKRAAARAQVVYILDMVRALEREMLKRIRAQGLNMTPQIIVITRLIPEALGAPWSRHVEQAPASAV